MPISSICPCNNRRINHHSHYASKVHLKFIRMCQLIEEMYDEFLREQ